MSKAGNEYTDKQIEELEKELTEVYSRAGDELEKKASVYFARFEKQDKEKQKLVAEGKMKQADYNKWRTGSMMTGQRWKTLKEQSAKTLLEANKNAVKLANGKLPSIYMFNYNETGKDAQDALKGISFDLINERALARMLKDKTTVLPFKEVDDGKKVERWDTRKINAEVTQGIIQGESVQKIAKRFRNVSEMDKRYSILNARTAMTGAENRGTLDGMAKLEEDGVILQKVWIATHDRRVRQSHQHVDGEAVPVKEEFSNGLMYPGDPDGDPEEVYGCRCSMTTEILGFKSLSGHIVAQGRDISETWQRRPDEFDFEIEDVINAQGFDGNPRIVSAEEFDELVKEANDGNGFIAQRTYSAPSQKILDEYRDQLYNGKWYVDCGVNGADMGQGMYCASDFEGKLTSGIKEEMKYYQDYNVSKRGDKFSFTETVTMDASAKIADYQSLLNEFHSQERNFRDNNIRSFLSENMSKLTSNDERRETLVELAMREVGITTDKNKDLDSWEILHSPEFHNREFHEKWGTLLGEVYSKDYKNDFTKGFVPFNDIGSYAAAKGYDAINAPGRGRSGNYTVILNRTKLIIKRPEK